MVEPTQFGRGAAFAAGSASGGVQRRLRTMSVHPEDPRVFSQAKILIMFALPLSMLMTLLIPMFLSDYVTGVSDDIFSIIVPGAFTAFCYLLLSHGLFRRFGVDRDKVWTRFGKLSYRQVRFVEIDRFDVGVQRYKLYAAGTKVNIDYNRFDYSLVYIRLLEELQYRRLKFQNVEVSDPEWEATAQVHRNLFANQVYRSHRVFYDSHPVELDRLQSLVQPPRAYLPGARHHERTTAQVNNAFDIAPLHLNDVCFQASTRTRKRLFGRQAKVIPMIKVSIAGQHMEFELSEVDELENGPILVSAFSAIPEGDYFLVTPSLIPPSSTVGASLQNAQFDESSLLLLHGSSILAELSAAQQADLLAWLKHLKRT